MQTIIILLIITLFILIFIIICMFKLYNNLNFNLYDIIIRQGRIESKLDDINYTLKDSNKLTYEDRRVLYVTKRYIDKIKDLNNHLSGISKASERDLDELDTLYNENKTELIDKLHNIFEEEL